MKSKGRKIPTGPKPKGVFITKGQRCSPNGTPEYQVLQPERPSPHKGLRFSSTNTRTTGCVAVQTAPALLMLSTRLLDFENIAKHWSPRQPPLHPIVALPEKQHPQNKTQTPESFCPASNRQTRRTAAKWRAASLEDTSGHLHTLREALENA